jgi:hypothetical protein
VSIHIRSIGLYAESKLKRGTKTMGDQDRKLNLQALGCIVLILIVIVIAVIALLGPSIGNIFIYGGS